MGEYFRLLSYVYAYEQNQKKENVGYVRLEGRDRRVRVSINIREHGGEIREELCPILFYLENQEWKWMKLPACIFQDGMAMLQTDVEESNLREALGMYIATTNTKEREYASIFCESISGIHEFREKIFREKNAKDSIGKQDNLPILEVVSSFLEESKEMNVMQNASIYAFLKEIFQKHTRCRVLEDTYECIRFRKIPIEEWPEFYGGVWTNYFLLQKYQRYQHILLIRDTHNKYYLGMPGQEEEDRVTAIMYGCKEFIPARGRHNHMDCTASMGCKNCEKHEKQEAYGKEEPAGYWIMEVKEGCYALPETR